MKNTLKETMSSYPLTIRPGDALDIAHARMLREKIRHLPVTDELGALVGIISDRDFKRAMWADSPSFQKGARVADFMSSPVKSLSEDSNLTDAIQVMIEEKLSAVVVLRGEEISGIITTEDLLRVLTHLLEKPNTLKEKFYDVGNSPTISRILQFLSSAGI